MQASKSKLSAPNEERDSEATQGSTYKEGSVGWRIADAVEA